MNNKVKNLISFAKAFEKYNVSDNELLFKALDKQLILYFFFSEGYSRGISSLFRRDPSSLFCR